MGNTAQRCRRGLFQDSDFAGDLEDSKSTSGGVLCIFGSHTFVPISWMCKKQTSVSHSSTEAEIISLDAGLRMDGIPALTLWDLVIEMCHCAPHKIVQPKEKLRGDPLQATNPNMHNLIQCKHTNVVPTNIDHIPPNTTHSGPSAMLYVFVDNEAVIKMIIKGRSSTMRHVSRSHWVALDWLFDWINLDPKIQIKYIDTRNQLADILTKGNFTRDGWNHLLCLFNISHFSSTACTAAMGKRAQQDSGEERVTAKSKPMMNLSARAPSNLSSSTSESPVKRSYGKSESLECQSWETKACDKRLNRLISYIHRTCEYRQYCHVGNTAKQCRLGLFQDSDFAGDLEDSKSTSVRTLCDFGSHTFVPISWMFKKQTSVSHRSTESETFLWMQDWGWTVFQHLIYGIWSSQFFTEKRIRIIKNGETGPNLQRERKSMERLMIWTMLNGFPQTSILLVRKLCYMCLKTTKQWSRWSSREEARQWDMFQNPQSCSRLVVR